MAEIVWTEPALDDLRQSLLDKAGIIRFHQLAKHGLDAGFCEKSGLQ